MYLISFVLFLGLCWSLVGFICLIRYIFFRKAPGLNGVGCLVVLIVVPVFIFVALYFLSWFFQPVRLSPERVVGIYKIDRNFYPGPQADWQHATYTLEIHESHLTIRDVRTEKEWGYPIEWLYNGRWKFKNDDPRHHLVAGGPVLYREFFGFYYVFESPLYGNVFYRKKAGFPGAWLALLLFALVFLIALRLSKERVCSSRFSAT